MSPLNINILLHVYAIVPDYRDMQLNMNHARSDGVRQTFEQFVRDGLIEPIFDDETWHATPKDDRSSQFKITEKGIAMVEAICAVQVPVCKWVQP
jgi:hypothetical protein